MAINSYDVGDKVKFTAAFSDADTGSAVDPNSVAFRVRSPTGTESAYAYDADAELERESAGSYAITLELTEPGAWLYRWVGTGDNAAADEGQIHVRRSAFS